MTCGDLDGFGHLLHLNDGGRLSSTVGNMSDRAITGLWLVIAAFQTFMLLLRATAMVAPRLREAAHITMDTANDGE